ncbi:MAG: hypothetical protein M9962_10825 [Oligoflexia bacterium]|nr:hypothetical protein [Oligoflexia bacterium]
MFAKFFIVSSILVISGCSYMTHYVPVERLVYPPTTPGSVAISTQKTVSQSHKVIGRVAAIVWGGGDGARSALQEEAARIGANLVIDLRLEKSFGRTSASGIAVLLTPDRIRP